MPDASLRVRGVRLGPLEAAKPRAAPRATLEARAEQKSPGTAARRVRATLGSPAVVKAGALQCKAVKVGAIQFKVVKAELQQAAELVAWAAKPVGRAAAELWAPAGASPAAGGWFGAALAVRVERDRVNTAARPETQPAAERAGQSMTEARAVAATNAKARSVTV